MTTPLASLPYAGRLYVSEKANSTDECVIALHSIGVDADSFAPLFNKLGDDYACISYDLRGHGEANTLDSFHLQQLVDDAIYVIESCRYSKIHLIGHSIGGVIAALAAAQLAPRLPERILSLSIIASPPIGLPIFNERALHLQTANREAIVASTMERWFGGLSASPSLTEAKQYAQKHLEVIPVTALISSWQSLAEFKGYPSIAESLPSVLLVTGDQDLSTPPTAMQPILKALHDTGKTQTELHIIDGFGHMLPLTPPDTLITLLRAHFNASNSFDRR